MNTVLKQYADKLLSTIVLSASAQYSFAHNLPSMTGNAGTEGYLDHPVSTGIILGVSFCIMLAAILIAARILAIRIKHQGEKH